MIEGRESFKLLKYVYLGLNTKGLTKEQKEYVFSEKLRYAEVRKNRLVSVL